MMVAKRISYQCQSTRRSAYGFILCKDKPGRFFLVYRHPENKVRQEYVVVRSAGYEFRGKNFKRVDDMIMYFKQDESRKASKKPSQKHK